MRRSDSLRSRPDGALCLASLVLFLAGGPAQSATIDAIRIVDTNTAVPGGPFEPGTSSTFTNVFSGPAEGDEFVFYGRVIEDSLIRGQGLYSIDGGGGPEKIVDTRDCIGDPCSTLSNTVVNFLNFSFDGTTTGFEATWNGFRDSVWGANGAVDLLAEEGDPVPGGSGDFIRFEDVAVGGGEVVFYALIPGSFQSGIYAVPPTGGTPRLVADTMTVAPDSGGKLFDLAETSVESRDGVIVFDSTASFGGAGGVYVEDAGGLRMVADTDTAAPGAGGTTFSSFSGVLTDDGDVVFAGSIPVLGGAGLYAERNETLLQTPIWRSGIPDPCDGANTLDVLGTFGIGDGAVVFVLDDGLYSTRIGTDGLSRLLVVGDTIDGKTITGLEDAMHHEAIEDGAVFPRLSFDDDSTAIYCLGIPDTPQCEPAPPPDLCLTLPEPGAFAQRLAALLGVALIFRARRPRRRPGPVCLSTGACCASERRASGLRSRRRRG